MGATRLVEVGPGGVLTGLVRRTVPDVDASAVASPDDLDTLVESVSGSETWHAYAAAHQGEHLYTSERVVVSPAAGIFQPEADLAAPGPGLAGPAETEVSDGDGVSVGVGALLGRIGDTEVRTPFAGMLVGFMAHAGERVVAGEPVAWLRVPGDAG
jgi:[acyl-carrier-protein] S-malonyltransferase